MKSIYHFEPVDPILDESDYKKELIHWAEREQKTFEILKMGKQPLVKVDGNRLICKLEPPKRLELPFFDIYHSYMCRFHLHCLFCTFGILDGWKSKCRLNKNHVKDRSDSDA